MFPLSAKIFALSILDVAFFEFVGIFIAIKLLMSMWFVYIGHRAESFVEMHNSYTSDPFFIVFGVISVIVLAYLFILTRKYIQEIDSEEVRNVIDNQDEELGTEFEPVP
jgi:uncharacterized membrane protein